MSELLQTKIEDHFQSLFVENIDVPEYILNNVNHQLRAYQKTAIRNLIFTQRSDTADIAFNHLLFHMATGSGKTLVLASTILYFYRELRYNKFIFFVHSDAIIKKTIDNLINISSPKYLFEKSGIEIDGNRVNIQLVENFPIFESPNTIYIKMTTIQKLHLDFNQSRENALSMEDLKDKKIILLSDEAHHINASTKKKGRKDAEQILEETWESTVSKLLRQNKANRLIEFTATINLEDKNLFDKYSNKIVYQYDLKKLMRQGYSKKVVLLRRDENDDQKLLSSILLSQYKKYIARQNKIYLKPVILFKSNQISTSKKINQKFVELIEGLNVDDLQRIIELGCKTYNENTTVWHFVYRYFSEQNLEIIIKELKEDFRTESLLNANEKSMLSESNARLLNTLESPNNPIRAIFAVAKLNEGWDVLNLFDIVRINEKAVNNRANTDSEAQLIGRGARYYPFNYDGNKSYQRRFDHSTSELKVIETLHYHTINDNSYIKNISASLNAASIEFYEDKYVRYEIKIKNDFKKSEVYREGKVYINDVVEFEPGLYNSFQDYGISTTWQYKYTETVEQVLGESTKFEAIGDNLFTQDFIPEIPYIKKALQRNSFYRLKNLKKYFANLDSMDVFMKDSKFLGDLKISITFPSSIINELEYDFKLTIIEEFLKYSENKIKNNYLKSKGTLKFSPINIREIVTDYTIELSQGSFASNYSGIISSMSMKNQSWYIYDTAIVNGLENNLIEFIANYIENLRIKYKDVYLIRNERKIKLVEVGGVRGFMPDFILYLKDLDEVTYQVFIEPKGEHLYEKDKWKEDMLLKISDEYELEPLHENQFVRIIGLKFYRSVEKETFKEDFESKLLLK